MSKITKITIENFRAFYKIHEFDIQGKNVLIYGENGSGKSSLFAAVRDFFLSSEPSNNITFDPNIYMNAGDNAYIKCEFNIPIMNTANPNEQAKDTDGNLLWKSNKFDKVVSASNNNTPDIQFVAKLGGWLTYRELLKTYLETKENDLFDILWLFWINDISAKHNSINIEKHKQTIISLLTKKIDISNYENALNALIRAESFSEYKLAVELFLKSIDTENYKKLAASITDNSQILHKTDVIKEFQELLEAVLGINIGGTRILNPVIERTNKWLNDIFNTNTNISFNCQVLSNNLNELDIKVMPEISYNNQLINSDYRLFLNEARLSALATCLYLSMLLDKPTTSNQIKILFLDDIFIGLDMSNRLPLLEILRTNFADWQIFITTYDKHWFELAKRDFYIKDKDKWHSIEMYAGKYKNTNIDAPCIIPTKDYLLTAKDYLYKKDYSACGLYLRKECEHILTDILKPAYYHRLIVNDTNFCYETKFKNLNDLILSLESFCTAEQIDYTPFVNLKLYKDVLFNPLAHNDIESPIYKQELQSAINALEELQKINTSETIKSPKDLNFTLTKPTGEILEVRLKLREALRLINNAGAKTLSKYCLCEFISSKQGATEIKTEYAKNSVQELFDHECATFGLLKPYPNLLELIKDRNDKTLEQYIADLS